MVHPSGTVTFLFTDIEGSTRRWETDPEAMRTALADHDRVLRSAVEAHGGWLFKHTGDGIAAAFGSAGAAVEAAIEAQRGLELPVRMGIATGEAQEQDGDYFGPVLNRAARVMAAGHGGQVLVAGTTAALVSGMELVDLGEHRLRDLSGVERLFQASADGLQTTFAALRTVEAVPGNLPVQTTSFVGREIEVKEVVELVRANRLVTLTGVGGVGKSRLGVQVAAELLTEFPDGVWLVELAPVSDPSAVPDAVATVLGITPQPGLTMSASIAQVLSARRLLIVLDNCEHLLDAAAELVGTILARAETVRIVATSREGLGLRGEHLWPAPPLAVGGGVGSPAVELFVHRALAVDPSFDLGNPAEAEAVTEICRRLDGLALAIELAAARIVSMSARDVRDHLGDRFRLLSGSRRGLERHQTLRHAVTWSFDLLDDDERRLLDRCAVFADGFDLEAVTRVCGEGLDQYTVLDLLDSLVRKSLVTVERSAGRTRYGMLETIREFAEERLAMTDDIGVFRDRHASHFADQAVAYSEPWDGQLRRTVDWIDAELANLRAAFGWAVERDMATAAAIAAHTGLLAYTLQRFEPVGWAETILAAPSAADLVHLPRVYTAASHCQWLGRVDDAIRYAEAAVALGADPKYDPFPAGMSRIWLANAERLGGRIARYFQILAEVAREPWPAQVWANCFMLYVWPTIGEAEAEKARADGPEIVSAARSLGNPFILAMATLGYCRAIAATDPERALAALRDVLALARQHRFSYLEALTAREAAGVAAMHGDVAGALQSFDMAIDSFGRAGNIAGMATTLAYVTSFFDQVEQWESAATIYGTITHGTITNARRGIMGVDLLSVADHLRDALDEAAFERCVAAGAGMDPSEAATYARVQIERARSRLAERE